MKDPDRVAFLPAGARLRGRGCLSRRIAYATAGAERGLLVRYQPDGGEDVKARRVALPRGSSSRSENVKVVLVTFLYTHCPDVCPLIAGNLYATLSKLGPAAKNVRTIAVRPTTPVRTGT